MPHAGKKHYNKQIKRAGGIGRLERDNYVTEDSLMKKGLGMRKQINFYWQKRAEEKKRRLHRATQINKS